MKKLMTLLLPLALALALTSCMVTDGEHTVTLMLYEGATVELTTENGKVTAPETPTRPGYDFAGWYLGEQLWSFDTEITKNVTLTAKWEPETYVITYELNGGKFTEEAPTKFTVESPDIHLPAPIKSGYLFLGWTWVAEDEPTPNATLPAGSIGNRTYTANFILNSPWQRALEQLEQLGRDDAEEIVSALKELAESYDAKVITWLADLYSSNYCTCYAVSGTTECQRTEYCRNAGGFYHSNSARDSFGYLPDIDSTAYVLSMLSTTGIVRSGYSYILPYRLKEEIIFFLIDMQDKNGYFYHPQWSKADVDAQAISRYRNLINAVAILLNLGSSPRYQTPTGNSGTGAPLHSYLPKTAPYYVSRVVIAASYAPHLKDLDTYKAYLDGLYASEESFGAVCDTIKIQLDEIKTSDRRLGIYGTDESLMAYTVNWLDSHKNADGTWGRSDLSFTVSELYRVVSLYQSVEHIIPDVEQVARAVAAYLTSEYTPETIEDIYYIWTMLYEVGRNAELYGTADERTATVAIITEAVNPEIIAKTTAMLEKFKNEDGGYSYTEQYSASTIDGMPVAVPNTEESDVRSTSYAFSIYSRIFNVLGISNIKLWSDRSDEYSELFIREMTNNSFQKIAAKEQ